MVNIGHNNENRRFVVYMSAQEKNWIDEKVGITIASVCRFNPNKRHAGRKSKRIEIKINIVSKRYAMVYNWLADITNLYSLGRA